MIGMAAFWAWIAGLFSGVFAQKLGPILTDAEGVSVPRLRGIDKYGWDSLTITTHRMAADVSACLVRDGDRESLFFCDDRSIAILRAGVRAVDPHGTPR